MAPFLRSNITIFTICFYAMEHSDLLVILQNSLWSSDESGNNPAVVRECEADDRLGCEANGGKHALPHLKAVHSRTIHSVTNPASFRIFVSC